MNVSAKKQQNDNYIIFITFVDVKMQLRFFCGFAVFVSFSSALSTHFCHLKNQQIVSHVVHWHIPQLWRRFRHSALNFVLVLDIDVVLHMRQRPTRSRETRRSVVQIALVASPGPGPQARSVRIDQLDPEQHAQV
jgi:hypothetical protein